MDALAVAVGSSHAMLTRDAVLDLGLITAIRAAVSVPLVLHGSSGVPDEDLAAAVRAGMTKINVATQLNKVYTAARPPLPGRRRGAGRPAPVRFGRARRGRRRGGPPARRDREEPVSRYRRWNELLELLATAGQLQVEDAAAALGVSAATVRRDLDELARQQMLTRIRGGAVAQGVTYDLPLRYKSERHPSEKQRIAAVAAGLVRPGQIAGLNGGTTTTEVARALAIRSDLTAGPPPRSPWSRTR